MKAKKEKIEEQDQVIKKLQERLQAKLDELSAEQKKHKAMQDELDQLKSQKEQRERVEKVVIDI